MGVFIERCKVDTDLSCTGILAAIFKAMILKLIFKPRNGKHWLKHVIEICTNGIALFLPVLNLSLIIICNPTILNPGPRPLTVVYNNMQGFVNTMDLASDSPPLNMTKVHEIHGFIFTKKPDIVILNET